MTSKVLVKLPVVPFSQRKKPPPEIISLPNRNDDDEGRLQGQSGDRVTQLEQNMKFLQDQHQVTLVALHQEVEVLRQRNRDLQFQLVFSKGTNYNSSSPSSPEDAANGFTKPKQGSPTSVNVAPLQVELLEKDLQDLKNALNEAKKRNTYLSEVIEKQKKTLETAEKPKEKQKSTDIGIQVDSILECQQVELQARLFDAEALVKRLRQENEEQRKEIETLKSSNTHSNGNSSSSGSSSNRSGGSSRSRAYHNRGSSSHELQSGQEENYHKFPPLQTQSYWHRASRGNQSYDHNSQPDYHRNSRHHQQQLDLDVDCDSTVLPQLRNGSVRVDNSSSYPPFFRSRGHHHSGGGCSGNYYKDDRVQPNRKYRGHQNKSRRDPDSREYGNNHQYKEPKDNNQRQQFAECSSKSPRDSRNTPRQ